MGCPTSVCTDVEFTLWNPLTWQQVSSFRYPRYPRAVAVNRTTLAGSGCLQNNMNGTVTCTQGFIQLWDTATGQAKGEPLVAPGEEIISVDFSPDGTRIAAGTRDGRIQLWDVTSRRMVESWQGHTGRVRAVRFSPGGQRIATAGQDGRAILWSATDVHAMPQVFSAYNSPVTTLAFSPNGRQLATGNELNIILLWSLDTATQTSSAFRNANTDPRSVAVSPDGKMIVLGGGDGIITVYDRQTQKVITRFPVAPVCPHKLDDFKRPYHPCYINVLTFSPNGGMVLGASSSGNIGRWDTKTWSSLGDPLDADVPCRSLVCDGRILTANGLAFSPDFRMVAVGGKRQIWVWNLTSRKLTYTLAAHDDDVTSLAFSSDGRILASGSKDKTILLWDLRDGHRIGKPMRHEGEVTAVAFQPRQNRLASNGADNTVRIWDTDTQEQVSSFRNDSANYQPQLLFSKDGTYLAMTTTNYYIALWDTTTQSAFELPPVQ